MESHAAPLPLPGEELSLPHWQLEPNAFANQSMSPHASKKPRRQARTYTCQEKMEALEYLRLHRAPPAAGFRPPTWREASERFGIPMTTLRKWWRQDGGESRAQRARRYELYPQQTKTEVIKFLRHHRVLLVDSPAGGASELGFRRPTFIEASSRFNVPCETISRWWQQEHGKPRSEPEVYPRQQTLEVLEYGYPLGRRGPITRPGLENSHSLVKGGGVPTESEARLRSYTDAAARCKIPAATGGYWWRTREAIFDGSSPPNPVGGHTALSFPDDDTEVGDGKADDVGVGTQARTELPMHHSGGSNPHLANVSVNPESSDDSEVIEVPEYAAHHRLPLTQEWPGMAGEPEPRRPAHQETSSAHLKMPSETPTPPWMRRRVNFEQQRGESRVQVTEYSRQQKIEVVNYLAHHRIPLPACPVTRGEVLRRIGKRASLATEPGFRPPYFSEDSAHFKIPKETISRWWLGRDAILEGRVDATPRGKPGFSRQQKLEAINYMMNKVANGTGYPLPNSAEACAHFGISGRTMRCWWDNREAILNETDDSSPPPGAGHTAEPFADADADVDADADADAEPDDAQPEDAELHDAEPEDAGPKEVEASDLDSGEFGVDAGTCTSAESPAHHSGDSNPQLASANADLETSDDSDDSDEDTPAFSGFRPLPLKLRLHLKLNG